MGYFYVYSTNNRTYRVFNSKTKVMMESINVVVEDSIIESGHDVGVDVGTSFQMDDEPYNMVNNDTYGDIADVEPDENQVNKGPSIRIQKDHPKELIIGNLKEGITTRSREVLSNSCF